MDSEIYILLSFCIIYNFFCLCKIKNRERDNRTIESERWICEHGVGERETAELHHTEQWQAHRITGWLFRVWSHNRFENLTTHGISTDWVEVNTTLLV